MACNDFELDPTQRPRGVSPSPPSLSSTPSSSIAGAGVSTAVIAGGSGLPPRSPLIKHKRLAPSSSNSGNGSFGPAVVSPLPVPSPSSSMPLSLEDRARASMRDDHQRRWAAAVAYRTQLPGGLWPPYSSPPGPLLVAPGSYQCRSCHLPLGDIARHSQSTQRLGLCDICEHNIRSAEQHEMMMMAWRDIQVFYGPTML
jgi:hypothetical protein